MGLDHISHGFRAIWKTELLKFGSHLKKIKTASDPAYLLVKSKTRFNAYFWGQIFKVTSQKRRGLKSP